MRLIFFIFCLGGLCFCAPPKWFFENQKDENILSGIGSGSSFQEAKSSAFSELASFINANISASSSLEQAREDEKLKTSASSQVSLTVKDIDLLNVSLLNQEVQDGIFYVRVGIAKEDFVNQIKKDIVQMIEKSEALELNQCEFLAPNTFFILDKLVNRMQAKIKLYDAFVRQGFDDVRVKKVLNIWKNNTPMPKVNIIINIDNAKIKNSILKELAKFSILNSQNLSKYPTWEITLEQSSDDALLDVALKNCQGNIIYQEQIFLDSQNLSRISFIFYKKLKNWLEE